MRRLKNDRHSRISSEDVHVQGTGYDRGGAGFLVERFEDTLSRHRGDLGCNRHDERPPTRVIVAHRL